jgi:hypothetical protein
LQSTIDLY